MNFSVEAWLMFAGRLHPALVHFPIALILVAAVMEVFRFGRTQSSGAARACLAFGALGAISAAFSGWRYAIEGHGGSMPDELFQHRWGAIIVAVISSLSWLAGSLAGKKESGALLKCYRFGLLLCACLVGYVGYLGGQMVYKPGHLTDVFKAEGVSDHGSSEEHDAPLEVSDEEPEPEESTSEGMPTEGSSDSAQQVSAVDYGSQIQPILEANCYECHGPTGRAKAGMRLSEMAPLFEGDSEYWVMLPGDSAGSYLVELISLPAESEDVMPPMRDGKPSEVLSKGDIALVSRWIDEGAKFDGE